MKVLRTPDERFAQLPDYDFEPRYIEVPSGDDDALRIHHVDVGPPDAEVVLCIHGEPTWSFLYRKMIPVFTRAGYDAPFPDESYKEAARIFPALVPVAPDDPAAVANHRAWEVLERWDKPFLTAFSDSDPITRGGDLVLRERIPGARGQPHTTIENAGHFLQEDQGEEFARVIVEFMKSS